MNAFGLIPLILVFPAIGFLFNALVGRRFVDSNRSVGEKWSGWFASVMALSALVIAILQLLSLVAHDYHAEIFTLFDWIKVGNLQIPWAFQIDTLSVTMMLVVTGVGSLIHIYAIGYMHGDPDFSRFFAYLNLFLFFMLILVTGNNYLMLFVGWEGVGLCSFLLIGFWFDRTDEKGQAMNANAARKAFVANRVGDLAMILAMGLLFWTFTSLTFNTVFEGAVAMFRSGGAETIVKFGHAEVTLGTVLTAVTALFLMGAAGKSAQIPLYIWLPDAMAGPTPVSALIHAATMVTSGIYLIVRSNVLFEIVRVSDTFVIGSITSPDLVAYIGAATAILAGLIAFTQFDIKKVLAYSTVSQLGFMIAAAGMGAYVAAMFHLVTHAFFKALLFLSSGSVIHGMEHGHHSLHAHGHGGGHGGHHAEEKFDPQDMRTMGGLRHKMPITFAVYMIGTLALAGIVPLAGFWSKDEILAHGSEHNQIVYWMLVFAAFCTAFYMGRQIKMTFFGEARHEAASHAHESAPLMTTPLIILAILTLLGGLLNLPYLSEGAAEAGGNHPSGINLAMEGWLEHSIQSFELSEAEGEHVAEGEEGEHAEAAAEGHGLLHLPHTPIVLSPTVAGMSTALALVALGASFFGVYGSRPRTAHERDPLQGTPIWWFAVLPINTVVMKGIVPVFNAAADWLGHKLDGAFWHDFFHERFIRDNFIGFAQFSASVLDQLGVDGLVNGSAKLTRRFADAIRTTQTGNVSGYALGVFIGVVALVVYFFMQTN
ncbi:MAG: NADH-quinone oxidoreductase subunit L [Chloroflexi bacterium]|nr:NADH-quinone oxidoreductase subunit L [Chloroflexota bacterium]MBP8059654.1 NADH-quinone oxidoreductase subunit L [Chloroflexota bacterium]